MSRGGKLSFVLEDHPREADVGADDIGTQARYLGEQRHGVNRTRSYADRDLVEKNVLRLTSYDHTRDLNGGRLVGGRVVAKVTGSVITPAIHLTIERDSMGRSGRGLSRTDASLGELESAYDEHWARPRSRRVVPELTCGIRTPSVSISICVNRDAVVETGCHVDEFLPAYN